MTVAAGNVLIFAATRESTRVPGGMNRKHTTPRVAFSHRHPCFIVPGRYGFFVFVFLNKVKLCGNPALGKSSGTIFPKPFAHSGLWPVPVKLPFRRSLLFASGLLWRRRTPTASACSGGRNQRGEPRLYPCRGPRHGRRRPDRSEMEAGPSPGRRMGWLSTHVMRSIWGQQGLFQFRPCHRTLTDRCRVLGIKRQMRWEVRPIQWTHFIVVFAFLGWSGSMPGVAEVGLSNFGIPRINKKLDFSTY